MPGSPHLAAPMIPDRSVASSCGRESAAGPVRHKGIVQPDAEASCMRTCIHGRTDIHCPAQARSFSGVLPLVRFHFCFPFPATISSGLTYPFRHARRLSLCVLRRTMLHDTSSAKDFAIIHSSDCWVRIKRKKIVTFLRYRDTTNLCPPWGVLRLGYSCNSYIYIYYYNYIVLYSYNSTTMYILYIYLR